MESSLVTPLVIIACTATALGVLVGARLGSRLLTSARSDTAPLADTGVTLQAFLDRTTREVGATVAAERLRTATEFDHKKELIDGSLGELRAQLADLTRAVGQVERERQRSHGELTEQLRAQAACVTALSQTTQQLREVLGNVKARGQWGERMADDVLKMAGLIEGINYRKQKGLTNAEGGAAIPDFTFFLPNHHVMHMDVKFPIDNYVRWVEADNDLERHKHRNAFLRDVRARLKELVGRGYLDGDDTVDCLLLFIPNESVYAFVNQHDPGLVETAMRQRIVVCSPLTLFAVLAVVRQAIENFSLERRAKEILTLLGRFDQQWTRYTEKLDKIQRGFATVHKDYNELMTTRTRALQRPLDQINQLRGGDAPDPDTLGVDSLDALALGVTAEAPLALTRN
jgi:DNA recombination protein RmuC